MTTPIDALKHRFYGTPPTPSTARYTRDGLATLLQNGVHLIEYRKKGGDVVTLHATLDPEFLPPKLNEDKPAALPTPHLLHVYCTEREGWRSVILDGVLKVD